MLEWLKTILGEAYTGEIDKAVSSEIGKAFVSKEDFNTVNEMKKKLEGDLKNRDEQLEGLKKVDPEQLQAEIVRLKGENKLARENYEKDLVRMQRESAVKVALAGKVHDPGDILPLLDMEKIELDEKGSLKGTLDELVKPIKENKPYLFIEKKPPAPYGPKPGRSDALILENDMNRWRAEAGLPSDR